ncbi:MAG: ARMT1-like domain-containing protein, partial [Thermofilaceae archaeon]
DFATGVYSVSLSEFAAEFERRLREPFAIDHLDQLERDLEAAETVLYVLDNAGECVLDLPLVKLLSQRARIVVAARGAAVFNDATLAEAEGVHLFIFSLKRSRLLRSRASGCSSSPFAAPPCFGGRAGKEERNGMKRPSSLLLDERGYVRLQPASPQQH